MLENKYHTPEAEKYRSQLDKITARIAELQYEVLMLQKEGKKIGDEYSIYLGLKEKEKEDVKES